MKIHSQISRTVAHPMFALGLLLVMAGSTLAQSPEIVGIGLSGHRQFRNTQISNFDSIHVVVSYTAADTLTPVGVAAGSTDPDRVLFYGYNSLRQDSLLTVGGAELFIDTSSFVLVPDSIPQRVKFKLSVADMQSPLVRSCQLVIGLVFEDPQGQRLFTPQRASSDTIGTVLPTADSVDIFHANYLLYRDLYTHPPTWHSPDSGDIVSRAFNIRFFLPEPADTNRLFLIFTNEVDFNEDPHVAVVRSAVGGERIVRITDAYNLASSPDILNVSGQDDSLRGGTSYSFRLSYEDLNNNSPQDTIIRGLQTDFETQAATMTEPRAGSAGVDTSILVIYYLPEAMDSVWLEFVEDREQSSRDSRSPHRILLVDSLRGGGQHVFTLDGRNFGNRGRNIAFSANGDVDSLALNAVYDVTLVYGDNHGNSERVITNRGYIYPQDLLTLQPTIDFPLSGVHENEQIYVQFELPEQPLPGSVHLNLRATQEGDPGSPRDIWLRTGNAGRSGFFLNGNNLPFSDVVDSVTGEGNDSENNRLVDQMRYLLRVGYRDYRGNAEVFSLFRTFIYDTSTDPPILLTPASGDTIDYDGENIDWSQFERALPGTLKITVRQTGGPEYDAGSPHILYVSDLDTNSQKRVTLQPAFIAASEGIDSATGGEGLVQRGIYECKVEYQDELANPVAATQVGNLYFPSGSTVYVRGRILGDDGVIPGLFDVQKFMLALRTDGGPSALRGLSFVVDGDVLPTDLITGFSRVWVSTDSVFTPDIDRPLANLGLWFGGPMRFDTFAAGLSGAEVFVFVTMSYPASANGDHQLRLILPAPENVYCGGDPVIANEWPIGTRDYALPVLFTDFFTEQDTAFGSLRVFWNVASETQNQGFNLYRRWEHDANFIPIASYTSDPELVGRDFAATAWRYSFVDRGLVPGARYLYRVEAVGLNNNITVYDSIASGIPQLPPNDFSLNRAYPNPFNGEVTFTYVVPYVANVEIIVYDLLGRPVRKLVNALLSPAQYTGRWDSKDDDGQHVPSGIYFCRMRAANIFDQTQKLVLMR